MIPFVSWAVHGSIARNFCPACGASPIVERSKSELRSSMARNRVRLVGGRLRVMRGWKPSWSGGEGGVGGVEAWAKKFISQNLWRVRPLFDADDLLQDAYYYFLFVQERYPEVVDSKHFFALFKTCFRNHVTGLSNKRTKENTCVMSALSDEMSAAALDEAAQRADNDGGFSDVELHLLLDEAPPELRLALERIVREQLPRERDGVLRETTNNYLCRLSGLVPGSCDLSSLLRTWLTEICAI